MTDPRSSQLRRTTGSSARRVLSPGADAPPVSASEDELTVISTRGPYTEADDGPLLHPLEVGKMLEGERLGQFVLQKFVGGGGMGVVFKALDTTLNREVAVKVLARSQSHDEETRRRFQNEAQSAARLDHDNIARVYYVGEDRGVHYIVFEFIEGVNLRDLVQQHGPLPLADAISYTLQVAEALAHASQRDVIHRDIKPSNVLITPDGKAKLVDMGLARLHQVDQADQDLTASGVTLGTFDYISPEQARDPRSADVRSDLYSLGCSCYYMLTGRPPFPEGTVLQKLLQHQGDDPPDPRNFRPELPVELTSVLGRLLAKNPARRYQQPSELIAELSALGERAGLASTAFSLNYRPVGRLAPAAWQRHLPWLVPLTILIVIVLALDYFWSRDAGSALEETVAPPTALSPAAVSRSKAQSDRESRTPSAAAPTDGQRRAAEAQPAAADLAGPEAGARMVGALGSLGKRWSDRVWQAGMGWVRSQASARGAGGAARTPAAADENSEDAEPATNVAPRAGATRVVTVAADRQGPGIYPSLAAACGSAEGGPVIELDFDGPLEERPITLTDSVLEIRAAPGRRPRLVFRPADADAIGYPRAMFTVAGGALTVSGVEFDFDLPRKISADSWTMFEIRHAEALRLDRVVLTIRNAAPGGSAFQPSVAYFEIKSPPGGETMARRTANLGSAASLIELTDCLARGEATLLRADEFESVRLRAVNLLLASSESLILAHGANAEGRSAATLELDLRQVTAIVRGGLARLVNDEDSPRLPGVQFSLDDCLLIAAAAAPWIEQRGTFTAEQFREPIHWSAQRVDFVGPSSFWRIENLPGSQVQELNFSQWEAFWGPTRESQCRLREVSALGELFGQKALHTLLPDDLTRLLSADRGPAAETVGCDLARLPTPAAE